MATPGRKSDKLWRDALHVAVKRLAVDDKGEERQRLVMIAEKCAQMALEGDMAAIREIGDRLDGKAHQSTDTHVELDVADNLKEAMREFRSSIASVAARQRAGKPAQSD